MRRGTIKEKFLFLLDADWRDLEELDRLMGWRQGVRDITLWNLLCRDHVIELRNFQPLGAPFVRLTKQGEEWIATIKKADMVNAALPSAGTTQGR
jgi:hypothetical protein